MRTTSDSWARRVVYGVPLPSSKSCGFREIGLEVEQCLDGVGKPRGDVLQGAPKPLIMGQQTPTLENPSNPISNIVDAATLKR